MARRDYYVHHENDYRNSNSYHYGQQKTHPLFVVAVQEVDAYPPSWVDSSVDSTCYSAPETANGSSYLDASTYQFPTIQTSLTQFEISPTTRSG